MADVVAPRAGPTLRPPGRAVKLDRPPPPTPMRLDLPTGTAILARTPQTLRAVLDGLPPPRLRPPRRGPTFDAGADDRPPSHHEPRRPAQEETA